MTPRKTLAAHGSAADAAPWIERMARVGFAAKAMLYAVVGVLAFKAAFGTGGRTTGTHGALGEILEKPFGKTLLCIMALGLIGYAVWRIIEGVTDPEGRGSDAKGMALRASFIARGLAHGALGITALRVAFRKTSGDDDGGAAKEATSRAMEAPGGEWLVIAVALGIAGYGLYQLYRAAVAKLSKQLDFGAIQAETGNWMIHICRFGIAARGLVFTMIGVLLFRAGRDENAQEAGGIGEALGALGGGDNGRLILGVVAVGMIAYGVYEAINARYRRIDARTD